MVIYKRTWTSGFPCYSLEDERNSLPTSYLMIVSHTELPWSGKNTWKMKFFPGQGKVREFCNWSGKFRKDFESQGKVREFEMSMSGKL